MSTRVQSFTSQLTGGRWAGEVLSAENLAVFPAIVDAAQFPTSDGAIVRLDSAAAVGATSLTTYALDNAIPSGTVLDFGSTAAVTVTVSDGSIANGDTTLGVTALSGPIAKNTVLDFGSGKVAVLSASAAASATSLTVYPLQTASLPVTADTATVPARPILAETTANAAAGATSISVRALTQDIADESTATYLGTTSIKPIADGTLLGRTIAERDAGTGFGPWASGDDEVYLLAFDITDAAINPECTLYRNGRVVREDLLPKWSAYTSGMKTALRAAYQCTKAIT